MIIQLQLIFKIEIGQRIIVDGKFYFITNIGIHLKLCIFIEIESTSFSRSFGKSGVLNILTLVTSRKVYITRRPYFNLSISCNPVYPVFRKPEFWFETSSIKVGK